MLFFRSATTLAFFATAAVVNTVNADADVEEPVQPPAKELCFDYSGYDPVDLGPAECTVRKFNKVTRQLYAKAEADNSGVRCRGGLNNERMAMTGTLTTDDAERVVQEMCRDQLAAAALELDQTDQVIGEVDLAEFYTGFGFLNNETGNFKQDPESFKGGYDKFNHISADPRLNDHYPTTDRSYEAGVAVNDVYSKSTQSYFNAPTDNFECGSNTAMCCWSRDRQYFDKNGNCKVQDCARQDPGDNTDLCWTEDAETDEVYPWPGDKTEGDLHCHGISWGDDDGSGYDINTMAKWNSLFYVSLYDHMYKRGYVGSITSDPKIGGSHPMCGCIEDMPTVARADCNQVSGTANYTLSIVGGELTIEKVAGSFDLEFEACEGYNFIEEFSPDDYESPEEKKELRSSNNDLAAFVFKQYLEGKIDQTHVTKIEETLIGYRNPDVNKSDKKREEACAAAFDKKFEGRPYEERVVSDIVGDSISA